MNQEDKTEQDKDVLPDPDVSGIELLVIKAVAEKDFRAALLAYPLQAAESIGVQLDEAEKAVLRSIEPESLQRVIESSPAFGVKHPILACATTGNRPDPVPGGEEPRKRGSSNPPPPLPLVGLGFVKPREVESFDVTSPDRPPSTGFEKLREKASFDKSFCADWLADPFEAAIKYGIELSEEDIEEINVLISQDALDAIFTYVK